MQKGFDGAGTVAMAGPAPEFLGSLLGSLHQHLALTRDVLSSNAALADILGEAERRAGAQGFAQVTQHLVDTSDALQGHNVQLLEAIQTSAAALQSFSDSVAAFEERFKLLEEYISSTRRRTGDIVKLSLQSKILSINARIEAARLGTSGAGFKVVADEMSNLAMRTESLSNDIAGNMGGMLDALLATSEEFSRNKSALGAVANVVSTLKSSSERLNEETKSVAAATGEMEQIAFNQVELQEYLEGIGRHAGWIREAATSLEHDLNERRESVAVAWRAAMPADEAHVPDALESYEERLYKAVGADAPEMARQAVADALAAGLSPATLLDRIGAASMRVFLDQAGREWPTEIYFRNGDVLESALKDLEPHLPIAPADQHNVIVLGNAFEDYHDLGRRLVGIALRSAGIRVVDLGLSVSNARFIEAIREQKARVVGVSTLLLHTAKWIPRLREELSHAGLGHVAIIAGGAPFLVDPNLQERFQVDGVGRSPSDAVRLVRALLAAGGRLR
ncbi:MAG: hypothetical protein GC168_05675 [Candidatus Hydrogenedens sp.]|nr:hypothetical protein [Candidatus Hydrogenedens sp.]